MQLSQFAPAAVPGEEDRVLVSVFSFVVLCVCTCCVREKCFTVQLSQFAPAAVPGEENRVLVSVLCIVCVCVREREEVNVVQPMTNDHASKQIVHALCNCRSHACT